MPTVRRSVRVPYSAEKMFDLVNDVERYPEFLHWCTGAIVESAQGNVIEATLQIGILGFHREFRTRNTLARPHRDPDRARFWAVSQTPRRVAISRTSSPGAPRSSLALHFEVTVSPFGAVFSKVFEELAGSQMGAFIARAKAIYGGST